jgi:uncharacterized membrane protein YfcA
MEVLDGITLALFAAGFVAWAISTVAAGGGSMLLVAATSGLLGGHAVAPVVTVASLMAGPARMALFWKHIDWRLVAWYLPGAVAGASLGGWIFTRLSSELVQLAIALFLLSTAWQFRLGQRSRSFPMRLHWFPAVSFASGMTSAIVGASGVLTNPFYLNYGMLKEPMVATRAVNSLVIQLTKIATYATLGVMSTDHALHGAAAGAGAVLATWLTRPWLHRLSALRFRQLAVAVMVVSGVLLLWQRLSP